MRRQGAAVIVVSAMACWLTRGGSVWAADTEADSEDALIHRGIELRRQGDDRAALDQLERAYAIKRSPHAAAQLGFVEQALGLWPQAEQHVARGARREGRPLGSQEPHDRRRRRSPRSAPTSATSRSTAAYRAPR